MTYRFRTTHLPVLCVFAFFASLANAQFQPQLSARPMQRVTGKVDRKKLSALPGTHPSVVARAAIGARLNAGTQLQHMVLVLQPSDEQNAALATLMDAQQDKTSASYHKWLTPDTFGQSFGVAPSDIGQVSSWLSDSGLAVENVSRSGRFITFSGSVGSVEAAFSTEMHQLTVDGEVHISNISDLSIPSALTPVVKGVARLNDFFPKSGATQWQKVMIPKKPTNSVEISPDFNNGSGGTHFVGAGDLANIFNATPLTGAGIDGTGITISVLGRSNISLGDVAAYRSFFGLSNNVPNIIVVGSDPGPNSDDVEASLDAEMAGSLATGAKVNFITSSASLVGQGIDTAGLYAVDNNIGDIITLSYGGCESGNGLGATTFWNVLWEQAAAQGQTVFVSTGDSGAAGCAASNARSAALTTEGVNALGSSAFNVAVGGSMFVDFGPATYWNATLNTIPYASATGYIPEAVWNEGRLSTTDLNGTATGTVTGSGIVGAGGGISVFTARPSWQTGSNIPAADPAGIAAGVTGTVPGPHRLVPDLVFIASSGHDGTIFCAEGICSEQTTGGLAGAGVVGGTSVATPAMASAQALIDAANGGRQGNANYYYYALANSQYTSSVTACQAVNGTAAVPAVALPASTCNFHDVVAGSNIVPTATTGTNGFGFSAAVGFDEASGLGSVNIANVANNWHTVTFHATTTSLTLTPSTGTHGSTMSAAIQVASGSGTPTGDVSIIASSITATGTPQVFTLSGGAVNGIVNSLPAGTYNVHAHYAGDGVFASSDSAPVSVNISKEASSFSSLQAYQVTAAGAVNSIASMAYASGELYLDTELVPASGNGTASGTVTFTVTRNGSPMPGLTTTLDTYGTTYLLAGPPFPSFFLLPNYATLPAGSYSVTANYAGDTSLSGVSAATAFAISPVTPAVTYTTSTAAITSGDTATLNVSIASAGTAAALATGTVTFTDTTTSTSLGSATLTNGKATLSTTAITSAGAHNIAASYTGDSNYNSASPAAVTITVGANTATTTVLTPSTTTPAVGNSVTLTGTVTPIPTATGSTVSFYDAGAFLGSGAVSTSAGKATLAVTNFTAGTHNLTASFSGNSTLKTSVGSLSLVVGKNGTSLAVGGTETSTYGQPVFFTVAIARTVTSTTAPPVGLTGVVSFYDGSVSPANLLGSATPGFGVSEQNYNATFSTSALTGGTHHILASYLGDANYGASTSITVPIVVAKANQTITITGVPTTANFGSSGPYAVSASSTSGLPVTLTVSGPATLSGGILTLTGAGTVTVTATQAGDSNYNPATASQTIVVGTLQLTVTGVISGNSSTGYSLLVTVKNTGTGTASNVQLTTATLGATNGSGLPFALGSIPGGGSASVSVSFPGSTGANGAAVAEKLAGTFIGGTFTGSFRAQLP